MNILDKLLEGLKISLLGIMIVFIVLISLAVIIWVISLIIRRFDFDKEKTKPEAAAQKPQAAAQNNELTLIDCSPEDAAVIMAIVSDESKIPVENLIFKSIKRID